MTDVRINFLKRPGTPRLGWMLLTAGAIGIAGALWLDRAWTVARQEVERSILAADQRRRSSDRPMLPPPPTVAQIRWQQAQVALQRPWLPTLRAVESATAGPVYLLSLSIDPSTRAVQLEGDAPSFDHAMAFVQTLDEDGTLAPATLISHEQMKEPGSGRPFVHFTATTRWNVR